MATRTQIRRSGEDREPKWKEGISPLDVRLDPDNPRLSPEERGSTQPELREIMIRRFKIDELADSIAATGFSELDPIIGYRSGSEIVIREGNRRIAALQLLLKPELAPERYRESWLGRSKRLTPEVRQTLVSVRILVYQDRDDVELDAYIGFRHVNGVLEWPAQEKARFIVDMIDRHGWSYEEIAQRIGSYPRHVERHYIASRVIEQARSHDVDGAENISIGVLLRALQAGGISEFLGITYPGVPRRSKEPVPGKKTSDFRFFVKATFGTKEEEPILPESRDLAKWGKILQSASAVQYLKTSARPSFDRAWIKSGGQQESVVQLLNQAADSLEDCVALIPDFKTDKDVIEGVIRCVKRLEQILRDFPNVRGELGAHA